MIFKLANFALVVLQLLMFKACGYIGISKIVFFNFSETERVNYQGKIFFGYLKKKKLWEKANTYQVLTINLQIYQQENFVCKVSQRTVKKLYPSTFCRSLRLGDASPKILTNQIEYNSGSLGCGNFGPSYSLTSETKCT